MWEEVLFPLSLGHTAACEGDENFTSAFLFAHLSTNGVTVWPSDRRPVELMLITRWKETQRRECKL